MVTPAFLFSFEDGLNNTKIKSVEGIKAVEDSWGIMILISSSIPEFHLAE